MFLQAYSYSQELNKLKLNTEQYGSLKVLESFDIRLSGNSVWDAARYVPVPEHISIDTGLPFAQMKIFGEKFVVYNKNKISLSNTSGFKLTSEARNPFSEESGDIGIMDIDYRSDKMYIASHQSSDSSWAVSSYDTDKGKLKTAFKTDDFYKAFPDKKNTGARPIRLVSSPDGKRLAFNISTKNFDNYCYHLVAYHSGGFLTIGKSCSEILKEVYYLNNEELFYVTQNHKSNKIMFHIVNPKGEKTHNLGCYAFRGLKGSFEFLNISPDGTRFYIIYYLNGKYFFAEYSFSGELIEKRSLQSKENTSFKSDLYPIFYDNKKMIIYGSKNNEEKAIIYHNACLTGMMPDFNNHFVYSIDDVGTVKRWDFQKEPQAGLLLENFKQSRIVSLPSVNNKKLQKAMRKTSDDFNKYVKNASDAEKMRKQRENSFQSMFEKNTALFNENTCYYCPEAFCRTLKFTIKDINFSVFTGLEIYQVEKYGYNFKITKHSPECVSRICIPENTGSMFVAALPKGKFAFLNFREYKKIAEEQQDKDVLVLNLKTYEETESYKVIQELFKIYPNELD